MKLLAWDTSSKSGALVALEWDASKPLPHSREQVRIVSEWALNVSAAQHSERLLWGIHQMLECCGWKLEEIDLFGVGIGPGSFTGLRIGITTARTLASTLGKPLIGVSSLAALARPLALHYAEAAEETVIVATSDAAKGELFSLVGSAKSVLGCACMPDRDLPGSLWNPEVKEDVLTPEELGKLIHGQLTGSTSGARRWVRIGEGRNRYPDFWKTLPGELEVQPLLPGMDQVQGRYIGLLCWEAYQAGLARDPLKVHPRYLRASDAEKNLKAGKLPKGPTRGDVR